MDHILCDMKDKLLQLFKSGEYKLFYTLIEGLDKSNYSGIKLDDLLLDENITGEYDTVNDYEFPIKTEGISIEVSKDRETNKIMAIVINFEDYIDGLLHSSIFWSILNDVPVTESSKPIEFIGNYYSVIYSDSWDSCKNTVSESKIMDIIFF